MKEGGGGEGGGDARDRRDERVGASSGQLPLVQLSVAIGVESLERRAWTHVLRFGKGRGGLRRPRAEAGCAGVRRRPRPARCPVGALGCVGAGALGSHQAGPRGAALRQAGEEGEERRARGGGRREEGLLLQLRCGYPAPP